MRLSGATRESRNETMSLRAKSRMSEYWTRGETSPSVRQMVVAPAFLAKRMALTVREE